MKLLENISLCFGTRVVFCLVKYAFTNKIEIKWKYIIGHNRIRNKITRMPLRKCTNLMILIKNNILTISWDTGSPLKAFLRKLQKISIIAEMTVSSVIKRERKKGGKECERS